MDVLCFIGNQDFKTVFLFQFQEDHHEPLRRYGANRHEANFDDTFCSRNQHEWVINNNFKATPVGFIMSCIFNDLVNTRSNRYLHEQMHGFSFHRQHINVLFVVQYLVL